MALMRYPLLPILLVAAPVFPATLTVNPDGTADYTTIQDAANDASHGDTISIAAGTYTDDNGDGTVVVLPYNQTTTLVADGSGDVVIDGEETAQGISASGSATQIDLSGLTFRDCRAEPRGAGLYADQVTSVTLSSCTFVDCETTTEFDQGGGIAIRGASAAPTSAELTDCSFWGCSAAGYGGGLYLTDTDATLSSCTFSSNDSSQGGAIEVRFGSLTVNN